MSCNCYSKTGKCLCVLGCDCICHEGFITLENGTTFCGYRGKEE